MTTTEIPRDQFLYEVIDRAGKQIIVKKIWGKLSLNYRGGNVVVLQPDNTRGCHYEIGLHLDHDEIALHFQGTPKNNANRLEGFRSYVNELNFALGHQVILGPHENQGRTRLWIKLPLIRPVTEELADDYADLLTRLIKFTFSILTTILNNEKPANPW